MQILIQFKNGMNANLITQDVEKFLEQLQKNQIIWAQDSGLWINPAEILFISFRTQENNPEATTPQTPTQSEPQEPKTMSPACTNC